MRHGGQYRSDGRDGAARLHDDADLAWAKVPIVLFSSIDEVALAAIAKEAGADAYLSKNMGDGFLDLPDRLQQLCEEILF